MTSSFCGKCGSGVLDSTDAFCRSCGASLIALRLAHASPARLIDTGNRPDQEAKTNPLLPSFRVAGWLSFLSAALYVAAFGAAIALGITGMQGLVSAASIMISIAGFCMIYLYWQLRVMLTATGFAGTNGLVLSLMALQAASALVGLAAGPQWAEGAASWNIVSTALSVAKGLGDMLLGICLLNRQASLLGLARPLCYSSVVVGLGEVSVLIPMTIAFDTTASVLLTVASVVPALLAGVATLVWYVTLGRVFLRASSRRVLPVLTGV